MDMSGRRILIVEDDYFQAQEIATFFRATGADVLGPALTLNAALQHAPRAEAAILDLDISGDMVFPVADALTARRVPFVFYSGRRREMAIPNRFGQTDVLAKPLRAKDLSDTFGRLTDTAETGSADIEAMLPLMRAWARILVTDSAVADRLVERTLIEAIGSVRLGDVPQSRLKSARWLYTKFEVVLERDGARLFN